MPVISGKAIGSRKPLFAEFSVPPPADLDSDGNVTLRALIAATVSQQVEAFRERQENRQFIRVLTEREINDAVAKGKVESGGTDVPVQEVDTEDAIATALQAFEDGIYLVSVDDTEVRSLDAPLFLQEESRVTFVRLTLLAGG